MPASLQKGTEKDCPFKITEVRLASFTVGAEAANAINVAVALKDANGQAPNVRTPVDVYLSDDSAGATPTVTVPDGGWAIGTNGKLISLSTSRMAKVIPTAAGLFDITITESTAKTFYLNVVTHGGRVLTSGAITFA